MNTEYIQAGKRRTYIFVVDDDPIMRASLDKYLTGKGRRVKAIRDGYDVLVDLEKEKPDLIVSDIRMEKLDGISLLKGMQNRIETARIPVIFMSAHADDEIMNQAKDLGAKFFLIKPFPLSSVLELIEKMGL